MIDVHSHILYGIDDGSRSIEDSVKMLKSAQKCGVTTVFLTPHYIPETRYVCPNSEKKLILDEIRKKFSGKLNIYLGNEIYINNEIDELVKKDEISTLGDSKYLLIELPVYNEYPNLENYLFRLRDKGYKIIIAHPERYLYFKNDFNKVISMCKQGIYFQGNYMSLYNKYGKSTKDLFVKILLHHCYSFMASDIHISKQKYYKKVKDAKKRIERMTDKNYANCIFNTNGDKIITGEEIEINFKEKLSILDRIRGNE